MRKTILCGAILLTLAGLEYAQMPKGVMTYKTDAGNVLANSKNMTLYTYDKDTTAGKSACNGGCAMNWPPLMATADDKPAGDYSIITRDDGSKQWAYKDKPLYLWAKDAKPGDTTGNGMGNGAWHLATP